MSPTAIPIPKSAAAGAVQGDAAIHSFILKRTVVAVDPEVLSLTVVGDV